MKVAHQNIHRFHFPNPSPTYSSPSNFPAIFQHPMNPRTKFFGTQEYMKLGFAKQTCVRFVMSWPTRYCKSIYIMKGCPQRLLNHQPALSNNLKKPHLQDEISLLQASLRSSTFPFHSSSENADCVATCNLNSKIAALVEGDVVTFVAKQEQR